MAAFGDRRVVGGDDQGGTVLRVQAEQQVDDLFADVRIEVPGGLVGQQQAWLHDQGAGDRDSLLLAAGQLGGQGASPVTEPDGVQELPGAGGRVEGEPRRWGSTGAMTLSRADSAGSRWKRWNTKPTWRGKRPVARG